MCDSCVLRQRSRVVTIGPCWYLLYFSISSEIISMRHRCPLSSISTHPQYLHFDFLSSVFFFLQKSNQILQCTPWENFFWPKYTSVKFVALTMDFKKIFHAFYIYQRCKSALHQAVNCSRDKLSPFVMKTKFTRQQHELLSNSTKFSNEMSLYIVSLTFTII